MAKWLQFRLFSAPTSQNVATSMPGLTSQSCSDSLPAVCLARQVGAIYRPPEIDGIKMTSPNQSMNVSRWKFICKFLYFLSNILENLAPLIAIGISVYVNGIENIEKSKAIQIICKYIIVEIDFI